MLNTAIYCYTDVTEYDHLFVSLIYLSKMPTLVGFTYCIKKLCCFSW